MRPLIVPAAAEKALRAFLTAVPDVTAIAPAGRIVTAIPPNDPLTSPLLLITLLGGEQGLALSRPAFQLDAYGGAGTSAALGASKDAADRLVRTAFAACLAAASDATAFGLIESCTPEMFPQYLPDEAANPPLPRYVARIQANVLPV